MIPPPKPTPNLALPLPEVAGRVVEALEVEALVARPEVEVQEVEEVA